jgi:cytochrome c nitrite reductase small subunit
MGAHKKRNIGISMVVLLGVGSFVLFFLLLGPPKLLAKSDTPGFCVSCHVMESQYEAWMHTGAHRRAKCVDCHLPNQNMPAHYIWKAIDGMKDVVVFHSGKVPDQIMISSHGVKVLQDNCIRCHDVAVTMIDKDRNCWKCHRRVTHKLTGAIETL